MLSSNTTCRKVEMSLRHAAQVFCAEQVIVTQAVLECEAQHDLAHAGIKEACVDKTHAVIKQHPNAGHCFLNCDFSEFLSER